MKKNKKLYHNFATSTAFIAVIWLVLKPSFNLQSLALCVIASAFASLIFTLLLRKLISNRMFYIISGGIFFKKDFYRYFAFMTREIFTSTVHILQVAIQSKNFDDEIIKIALPKNISAYRTLLVMKSITLTPGTSVIDVQGNILTVHCLTKSSKNSLEERRFIHKVLSFKL